jgi:hypothetical protein
VRVDFILHIGEMCDIMLRCIADREILEAMVHGTCIYDGKTNSAR